MKFFVLNRIRQNEKGTWGMFNIIDDETLSIVYTCPMVELPWKDNKRGVSCVPAGAYNIVLEHSPRFNRTLWELKGVPNRSECKIHSANHIHQLEGCLAPGLFFEDIDNDNIIDAKASFPALEAIHTHMGDIAKTKIFINDTFIPGSGLA